MPSFFKSLKQKLHLEPPPVQNEQWRGPRRRRGSSPLSVPSSVSSISRLSYDEGRTARFRNRNQRGAISISEPQVGQTRKERARDDGWDQAHDGPETRHTDGLIRSLSNGLKFGRLRISVDSKDQRGRSKLSQETAPGPRTSTDTYLRKASPRSSQGHVAKSNSRRSRNQGVLYRRSTEDHHHRRRHKSPHSNLSRQDHRSSDSWTKPAGLKKPLPPMPKCQPVQEDGAMASEKFERHRRKEAGQYQADEDRLWRERDDYERQAREPITKRRKEATQTTKQKSRGETEEERYRNRHATLSPGKKRDAVASPKKKDLPRLTKENLRATVVENGSDSGSKESSLGRPLGDMTRTYVEGMVPRSEAESEEA